MNPKIVSRWAVPGIVALGAAVPAAGRPKAPVVKPAVVKPAVVRAAVRAPLYFEPNRGQTDQSVTFMARSEGLGLFLTGEGAVFRMRHPARAEGCRSCAAENGNTSETPVYSSVRMRLVGADTSAPARGAGRLPGHSAYLRLDGRPGVPDVPHFRSVRRDGIYPGVDLVVYGNPRRLEYDFIVAPGADPQQVRLGFDGVDVRLERGGLALETPAGRLAQHPPVLYQTVNGKRRPVAGRYVRRGAREVGFAVERYDRTRPLVIDPVLSFSTYLGGSGTDEGRGIAVDKDGNIVIAGQTDSPNFPNVNQPPEEGAHPGTYDAFITRYNPTGTAILYSVYVGSEGSDAAEDVKTDAQGNAYITGGYNGDMFVLKLSPTGAELYGWLYGGTSTDSGLSIAVDAQGFAYVTGMTESWDYDGTPDVWEGFPVAPVPGAIGQNRNGSGDAFVCKVAQDGASLVYSTYLGGDEAFLGEKGNDIAIDTEGSAYVVGETSSASFPVTTTGLKREYGGWLSDGWLAKINPTGTEILYATYLGGDDFDAAYGVALDKDGAAYVTGSVYSTDFPISANAFQTEWHISDCNPDPFKIDPCPDAFVTKIDTKRAGNASMVYSTYLGWDHSDYAHDIAVDAEGRAYVVGQVLTVDFPEKDPLPTKGLATDAFVTVFNADGSDILFSTRIGGDAWDVGLGLALGPTGDIFITGRTESGNFPTAQPYQNSNAGGNYDAFVARIGFTAVLPAGDVDGNGTFDVNDVMLAVRMAGGLAPGGDGAARADVADPKGQVTMPDALLLLRRLRG